MKAAFERLNYIWDALLQSDLVQNPTVTESSISEFARALNKSTPITPSELTTHETVRHLSLGNKRDFIAYLRSNNMGGLILTCDGKSIADELGLSDRIEIYWNNITKEYDVRRLDAGEKERNSKNKEQPQKWGDMPVKDKSKYDKKKERKNDRSATERKNDRYTTERKAGKPARDHPRRDLQDREQKTAKGKKKHSIPPVSSKEHYELLKKLRETKTYSEAAEVSPTNGDNPIIDESGTSKEIAGDSKNVENMETAKITETTIGVQNPNGSIEKIDITNEDLLAIAAIVGNV